MSVFRHISDLELANSLLPTHEIKLVSKDEDELLEDQSGDSFVIDDWLYVVPHEIEETHMSLGGSMTRRAIVYDVLYGRVIPGCHYYPDGSGEPDEYFRVDISRLESLAEFLGCHFPGFSYFQQNNQSR